MRKPQHITEQNITEPSIDRSISDRPKIPETEKTIAFSRVWFDSSVDRINEIIKLVSSKAQRPARSDDSQLAIVAIAIETQLGICLDPITESMKRKQQKESIRSPWGYFRSALIEACRVDGHDFHRLYGGMKIPEKLIKPKQETNA